MAEATIATPRMSMQAWLMIGVLSVIWGGSFLFGKVLVAYWPPFTIVFSRVFLAAITLWAYIWLARRGTALNYRIVGPLILMGILNNAIPFSLIVTAQQEIGAGLASIINAMTPIWTVIFAHYATVDEKFARHKIAGIAVGFTGVSVLVGADLGAGFHASAWAQIAVLGATVSYGIAGVYAKQFRTYDPALIAAGQLSGASLVMLPLMLIFDDFSALPPPTWTIIGSIAGFAVLCTALAYVLFFRIVARVGATNVSLVTLLVPASAIMWGVTLLGERLTPANILGMMAILAGLVMIDGRIFDRR